MPDELDVLIDAMMPRLMPQFRLFARSLIEAGMGLERERVIGLIQRDHPGLRTESPRSTQQHTGAHGIVSRPVLGALRELAIAAPEGLNTTELTDHLASGGNGLTAKQVRAALKNLTISGEAIRTSRGRYLPRGAASSASENPEASSSGSFSLAAE
jgi:hypothetical protein